MEWYINCIKNNYANFNGRARREEYWMFTLFNMIAIFVIFILMFVLALITPILGLIMCLVYLVYALGVFIPNIAVTTRRLHDTDMSGWWILIAFIPFGSIVLLVFLCSDSMPMENQYGPNPKAFKK